MGVKSQAEPLPSEAIDDQVREVLTLLSGLFRALKQKGGPKHEGLRAAFEEGELGDRHIAPLATLAMVGPLSVTELAERIGLTLGTTSLLVGELSRAGLVERREDEQDRRRTIVSVSEKVQDATEPWLRQTLEPIRRGLESLSPTRRAHLMEGLRVLHEAVGASPAGDAGADC